MNDNFVKFIADSINNIEVDRHTYSRIKAVGGKNLQPNDKMFYTCVGKIDVVSKLVDHLLENKLLSEEIAEKFKVKLLNIRAECKQL